MIKKILLTLFVAAMAVTLGACTLPWTKEETSTSETVSGNDVSANSAVSRLGFKEGNIYKNEYFNFKLIPATGYSFIDSAAMSEVSERGDDILNGAVGAVSEETAEVIKSDSNREAACCVADENMLNNVLVGIMPTYGMTADDINDYIDYLGPMVNEVLEYQEMAGVSSVRLTTIFRGEVVPCLCTQATIIAPDGGTVNMYQKQVFIVEGDYMAQITACSYFSDVTDKLLDMISYLRK